MLYDNNNIIEAYGEQLSLNERSLTGVIFCI